MPLVVVLLIVAVIGAVVLLIDKYAPIDPTFKTYIKIIAIVVTSIWLLKVFGVWQYLFSVKV